jgi:hypothetical protein
MNGTTKRRLTIAGLFSVHLTATACFSFWVLGFILARHHNQLSPATAAQEPIVRGISSFFEFPLVPLSRIVFGSAAVPQTMLLWLPNSILWAFVIYHLVASVRRQFRK